MSLDIYFNVASWFPGNVCVKPHFKTQYSAPPPIFLYYVVIEWPQYIVDACRTFLFLFFLFSSWISTLYFDVKYLCMFEQAWTFVTLSYIIRGQIPTKIGESLLYSHVTFMCVSYNLDKFHVISNTNVISNKLQMRQIGQNLDISFSSSSVTIGHKQF